MASIRKRGDSYEVFIFKCGIRTSKTFPTKAAATAWAAVIEADIIAGKTGGIPNKTFAELLDRYVREVSPTKKGERWERIRIELIQRDQIAKVKLSDLAQPVFAGWRDRRLKQVSAASVKREWILLSGACTVATNEWHWLKEHPMKGVSLPKVAPPRDRLATDDEIERLKVALGYTEHPALTVGQRVACAMLFGIETGMRAGEICSLQWWDISKEKRTARIRDGKTDAAKRDVALSAEAIRILEQLGDDLFKLTPTQIDANFRKAKAAAGIEDLHFHDMRHLAVTRLAKKLDILSLARMIGHRDIKQLQLYYNESAEEIAKKL